MARRWVDGEILGKVGLGLLLIAISTVMYFTGTIWPWGWVVGVGSLGWGLFSIGDHKSEWE